MGSFKILVLILSLAVSRFFPYDSCGFESACPLKVPLDNGNGVNHGTHYRMDMFRPSTI